MISAARKVAKLLAEEYPSETKMYELREENFLANGYLIAEVFAQSDACRK